MSIQRPNISDSVDAPRPTSKPQLWTGGGLSTLVALFLLWHAILKLVKPPFVVKATRDLGYPQADIVGIGFVLLICTLLYLIPRTSILGAVLLTGYLGGAIASQLRAQQPWFNIIFAFVFGCLLWAGLWLRNPRVRTLLPLQA